MNRLELERLGYLGSNVFNLIEQAPGVVAYVRDLQTGKYILNNYCHIELLGLKLPEEIAGMTLEESWEIRPWYFGPQFTRWRDSQKEAAIKLDHDVGYRKCSIKKQVIAFTAHGFILFKNTIKLPILSLDNRKSIAVLTCGWDTTLNRSLFSLFRTYQEYYSIQKAINLLLRYLKLDSYFSELPTPRELEVLFAMRENKNHKYVGNFLNLSAASVHTHTHHLHNKLKAPGWHNLLGRLRAIPVDENNTYQQYT